MIRIILRRAALKEEAARNAAGKVNGGTDASGSATGRASVRMRHHARADAQKPNRKWFDKPLDRLTVLSKVEGLTTLSQVEGQIQPTEI